MGVFRDVVLNWHGTEYTVTPTLRLLRRIENNDVSLTDIAVRTARGQAPISHIAYVLSVLLKEAGAPHCSEEEVYQELIEGSQKSVVALVNATLEAFSPGDDSSPKRRAAHAKKAPTKKA